LRFLSIYSQAGHEFGTTTGRPRRCGWLDIPLLRYSHRLNGYDSINITKLDVMTGLKTIKVKRWVLRFSRSESFLCVLL